MCEAEENRTNRVAVLSFNVKSVVIEFVIFVILVGTYSYYVISNESSNGRTVPNTQASSYDVVTDSIGRISQAFPLAILLTIIIAELGGWLIMFLWNLHKRKLQEAAEAKGREEGRSEGKAERDKEWRDWNERRELAEKEGGVFNNPPPSEANSNQR